MTYAVSKSNFIWIFKLKFVIESVAFDSMMQ